MDASPLNSEPQDFVEEIIQERGEGFRKMVNERRSDPLKIATLCERYRQELHDFTNSLPGIIAGNEVSTKRADLVKWMGGFKRAAHHLRLAHDEIKSAGANLQQGEGSPDAQSSTDPSPTSIREAAQRVLDEARSAQPTEFHAPWIQEDTLKALAAAIGDKGER